MVQPLFDALALGSLAQGFASQRKRSKFRARAPLNIKDLTIRAVEAQAAATEGAISTLGRLGTPFLQAQQAAQERFAPEFFRLQKERALGQAELGRSLISGDLGALLGRQAEQRLLGGLTSRGVAESLSQRLRSSIALAGQQAGFRQQGLNLLGQAAQTGISTPFGINPLSPGIPNISSLVGGAQAQNAATTAFDLNRLGFISRQREAAQAAQGALFGRLASGFGGAATAPGGQKLERFFQGIGIGPSSSVGMI